MSSQRRGKIVPGTSLTGQQGINLIATTVAQMGYLWTPTSGHSDAGIDGYIEIRRKDSGEATNFILQVQSKATVREWENENDNSFDFRVDERDLAYWLQGNAPVILVVSRPRDQKAYWISVKEYFAILENRKSRKVRFNKTEDVFNPNSATKIADLAIPSDAGVYLAPPPKFETLYSNLLPVGRFGQDVFVADTQHRKPAEVWAVFRKLDFRPGSEWYLKDGKIISFHDLRREPWTEICDAKGVRKIRTEDWAGSNDKETTSDFVRLLGLTLKTYLGHKNVWFEKPQSGLGFYYFAPTLDLSPRVIRWKKTKECERTVFQAYPSKKDSTKIAYYRHLAFVPQFRRLGGTWLLEITPTYHFTSDGRASSKYRESYLSGIKRIEKHVAFTGNVFFWAHFLTAMDLFSRPTPFLTFLGLWDFKVEFGIRDADWLAKAEDEETERLQESTEFEPLLIPDEG